MIYVFKVTFRACGRTAVSYYTSTSIPQLCSDLGKTGLICADNIAEIKRVRKVPDGYSVTILNLDGALQ